MNDERHAFWSGYLRFLADRLTLKDWDIELIRDSAESSCYASVWIDADTQRATVRLFQEGWEGYVPEKQRHYLLHELVHCHLERIDAAFRVFKDEHETDLTKYVAKTIHHEVEMATDDLARAFAPFFPLPNEWYDATKAPHGGPDGQKRAQSPASRRTDGPYDG